MIEWLWPWVLVLAPLPWLVRRSRAARQQPAAGTARAFLYRLAGSGRAQGKRSRRGGLLPVLALWLIWLLLLLAAARPVWIGAPVELPDSGRDLMLAVDISGSMRIEDMQLGKSLVSRIEAVKQVGAQFIGAVKGDRLGLILFGSNAYVQSPLSFDTTTVERFLTEAQIGFAGPRPP